MMENFKITNKLENPLFNRREIQISVDSEVTPNRGEVGKLICEKFSTQPENIKIKKISGKFGSKIFTVSVNIYSSKKDKDDVERVNPSDAEKQEIKNREE